MTQKNREISGPEAGGREVRFGDYQFYPDRGVLLRKGSAIKIGSRARALLAALVDRPGETVSYQELMNAGWPGTHVDDANLRVQMSALRRLLDAGSPEQTYITNAPGRGYALITLATNKQTSKAAAAGKAPVGLTSPLTTIIGRGEDVGAVIDRIGASRCVTVVGTGGIGKTRVAVEACWCMTDEASRRIVFVDLAPLSSADFVIPTIASAFSNEDGDQTSGEQRILKALRTEPTLLVLDNCEHVLDEAAALAERLLREVGGLRILATSREPFLIEGETILRLVGLAMPAHDETLSTLDEAMRFPALELLAERARSSASMVTLDDSDIPALVQICRRLDGIPLAIELAAPRIEAVGVQALASMLDEQFAILGVGRRSALPRHRTLAATLEWSFDMLGEDERNLLVTLSVFRGEFPIEAAVIVAPMEPDVILKRLANLVTKSLVMVARTGATVSYRLLETTRAFCGPRLTERADAQSVYRRHADYCAAHLERAIKLDGNSMIGKIERTSGLRSLVSDVRSAIDWGLHRGGDPRLAVKLIVDSGPMWLRLSMLKDYAYLIEGAIDILAHDPAFEDTDLVWLAPSMHKAWYNSLGLSERVEPMLIKAIDVARRIGDNSCLLDCLWALFGTRLTQGRYGGAVGYARQFQDVAEQSSEQAQHAIAHRIVALSMWRDGVLEEAAQHGRVALQSNAHLTAHVQLDLMYKQGVTARANMSNLLWLTGQTDAALDLAHEAVTIGLSGDLLGLSYGLAQTIIPLTFWVGDIEQAESLSALLVKIAVDNDYGYWAKWGKVFQSVAYRLKHGTVAPDDAIVEHQAGMEGLHRHILATILPDLPMDWVTEHDNDERRDRPHWCTAELQRVAAVQLLKAGDIEGARAQFEYSADTAAGQGALGWELRANTNLAELDLLEGNRSAARERMSGVLGRVKQGAKTADVRNAQSLLARLS